MSTTEEQEQELARWEQWHWWWREQWRQQQRQRQWQQRPERQQQQLYLFDGPFEPEDL